MGGTELNYINDAFDKNWIAPLGENVTEFENSMKDYVGVDRVAVGSGTSAIHLALIESGVQKMMLFCSSLTFSASANPIIYQGATPVFIDSEMSSWNMSPDALRKAFETYSEKVLHLKQSWLLTYMVNQLEWMRLKIFVLNMARL